MTAAVNVYGNVREYDTDLDVFGVVFEWEAAIAEPARDGVALEFRSRIIQQSSRSRIVIIGDRSRTIDGRAWR
jgi:hypothetical protein